MALVILIFVSVNASAATSDLAPEIEWQKCLGGSGNDYAYSIQQTSDDGYIVAGVSASNDGNLTGNHGNNDCGAIKLDKNGNIVWQKSLGGSRDDSAHSVQQTSDGGYIVAGSTQSNDGDVTGNHGYGFYGDYFVVKFTNRLKTTPTIIWNNPVDIVYVTALSSTQLNAVATDPVTQATLLGTYSYTPAEGAVLIAGTQKLHVDFTPADTAKYNTASKDVTINVIIPPPTINSITVPFDPVQVATSITASANVTYLGSLNELTAEWNWGDGSTSESQVLSNFATSHVYSSPGVYTVTFMLKDKNGGIYAQTSSNCVVVYDPQRGFVTGGGWINSPVGAYVPDNILAGKATFGFVSKYEKGATIPTGKTEFQFKVADLNFHSENYDWLVVAGSQAKYKGTGTINGGGNYGFMLSAIDGAIKGDNIDKFRIKIWDKESGDTIYDNEIETGEDSEPSTSISGGSMIIHREK